MDRVFIYDNNGYFAGEDFPQIDPLESQKAGREILIMPANSTDIEPPEDKEGFRIKWNGSAWEYEEIEEVKEVKPELHEPTEAESHIPTLQEKNEEIRQQRQYRFFLESDPIKYDYEEALARGEPSAEELKVQWLAQKDKIREELPYLKG